MSNIGKKGALKTNTPHLEAKQDAINFTVEYCEKNPKARKCEIAKKIQRSLNNSYTLSTIEEWIKDHVLNKKPGRPKKI